MSSKKEKIFESFGALLRHVLKTRGKKQSWLVRMTGKDAKQISDYVNSKTTPYQDTQQDIVDSIGAALEHLDDGRLKFFDPHVNEERPSIEEMIDRYRSRKEKRDFSDNEEDLLLEVLLEESESLAINLRRYIEIKRRGRHD